LHPGEEWKRALKSEIVQRDLFLLFWSQQAKQSRWVQWEWQTALRHKDLSEIQPHPLDTARPPRQLEALHFGDPFMEARRVYESSARCKKCQEQVDRSWKTCPYCGRSLSA
jgi:hypothetical protein